jgi:hypothetical protein
LFRSEDRNFSQTSADVLPGFTDIVCFQRVLSNDPKRSTVDLSSTDFTEGRDKTTNDCSSEFGELLDNLLDELDDIDGGCVVEIGDKVHQQTDNTGCDLGELDGALVNGVDEQRAILVVLLVLLVDSLGQFFLEQQNNFLDVLARDHIHGNAESLSTDIKIGTGQNAQNLHGQVVEDTFVDATQLVDLLKDNQLDIVIRLFDAQFDEFSSGCLYCDRVAGESCERRCGFVDDGRFLGLEKVEDQTEIASLFTVRRNL